LVAKFGGITFKPFEGPPDLALAAVAVDVHMHLHDLQVSEAYHDEELLKKFCIKQICNKLSGQGARDRARDSSSQPNLPSSWLLFG